MQTLKVSYISNCAGVPMVNRKTLYKYTTTLMVCLLLTGCTGVQTEEDSIILMDQEEESASYNLTLAKVSDIELTQIIKCEYQAVTTEDLSFSIAGKEILKVYIKKGDTVEKGQLLAELISEDIESQIKELEYEIAKSELFLRETEEKKSLETKLLMARCSQAENWTDYPKSLANIEAVYQYAIEDYTDLIQIQTMRLKALAAEAEKGNLYAGMSGTVSYVRPGLEGMTTKSDERVISIIDNTQCIFTSSQVEYAGYFTEGTVVEMDISTGSAAGVWEVLPDNQNGGGEVLQFVVAESTQYQESALEVGTRGIITLLIDRREQVLCVPKSILHMAEDSYYVYALDDNGNRVVKWVTPGLFGDSNVEIMAGLSEGDKVIVR